MSSQRPYPFLSALVLATSLAAQTTAPEQQATLRLKDPVQGAWDADQLARDASFWSAPSSAASADAGSGLYHQFRSQRNLALQRGAGHLSAAERARLEELALQVEAFGDPVDAAVARFHLRFPNADQTQLAALTAAAEHGMRDDLLGPLLVSAVLANDAKARQRWAGEMARQQAIAPGLLTVADDLLLSVEQGGVLFAAGEMDAYPVWVRQETQGKRRDVHVVDVRLLENPAYRQREWQRAGGNGKAPADPDAFLRAYLHQPKAGAVHLSLALGSERLQPFITQGYLTGLAVRVSADPIDNIALLEDRWKRFGKATDAGPLGRNYLVPGSLLLRYYRETGNEQRASEMEHELRRFSRAIGATNSLYGTGILEH